MSMSEKLMTIAENEQLVANANAELEEALYSASEGGKSYYDVFWDNFQDYGNKRNYRYAFANYSWGEKTFKPKHKIILGDNDYGGVGMFFWFGDGAKDPPFDYRKVKDMIDLSQTQSAQDMFQSANMDYIDVDLSNCRSLYNCFGGGWQHRKLTHVTLKVSDKCTNYAYTFSRCIDLSDLTFKDGSVIAADISFHESPLNRASFESVIKALSPSVSGKTVTFNKSAKEAAFTTLAEWNELIDKKDNWTITLAEEG